MAKSHAWVLDGVHIPRPMEAESHRRIMYRREHHENMVCLLWV